MTSQSTEPPRDPKAMLVETLRIWGGERDLWVFGYASLIWKPEFEAAEQRPALVRGWHRALRMRSRINRGTPECPGLVFALVSGGSCRGVALRIDRDRARDELDRLWAREMPTGIYDPTWLACDTPQGPVRALAFTLSRTSPHYTGALPDAEIVEILRSARGRFGSTLDYVKETAASLQASGIHDREAQRIVALAQKHSL